VQIRFGPFILNLDTRQLTRGDREIPPRAQGVRTVAALALDRSQRPAESGAPAAALARDLRRRGQSGRTWWGKLREALGDRARAPKFIRTVHGVGYAFCGDATTVPAARAAESRGPRAGSNGAGSAFRSHPARTSSGRSADVEVRLDAPSVSRRHARLVVTPGAPCWKTSAARTARFAARRGDRPDCARRRRCDRIGLLLVIFHARLSSTDTQTLSVS